jgi:hypothetical protein
MYGVLSRRRARVLAEDVLDGTQTFIISALLPVVGVLACVRIEMCGTVVFVGVLACVRIEMWYGILSGFSSMRVN